MEPPSPAHLTFRALSSSPTHDLDGKLLPSKRRWSHPDGPGGGADDDASLGGIRSPCPSVDGDVATDSAVAAAGATEDSPKTPRRRPWSVTTKLYCCRLMEVDRLTHREVAARLIARGWPAAPSSGQLTYWRRQRAALQARHRDLPGAISLTRGSVATSVSAYTTECVRAAALARRRAGVPVTRRFVVETIVSNQPSFAAEQHGWTRAMQRAWWKRYRRQLLTEARDPPHSLHNRLAPAPPMDADA